MTFQFHCNYDFLILGGTLPGNPNRKLDIALRFDFDISGKFFPNNADLFPQSKLKGFYFAGKSVSRGIDLLPIISTGHSLYKIIKVICNLALYFFRGRKKEDKLKLRESSLEALRGLIVFIPIIGNIIQAYIDHNIFKNLKKQVRQKLNSSPELYKNKLVLFCIHRGELIERVFSRDLTSFQEIETIMTENKSLFFNLVSLTQKIWDSSF